MREKKFTQGELVVSSSLLVVRKTDAIIVHSGSSSMMMPEGLAPTFEESVANAHLIAAAPELLEEAESALHAFKECDILPAHVAALEKVIAKAYGEAP